VLVEAFFGQLSGQLSGQAELKFLF
jgi:hypothetical protein